MDVLRLITQLALLECIEPNHRDSKYLSSLLNNTMRLIIIYCCNDNYEVTCYLKWISLQKKFLGNKMKKIVLLCLALGLFLTTANAATKKSSWIPYPDYIKSKKK